MLDKFQIPIKDSIGFNLLRVVFSIYIIVAIIVTLIHMVVEYINVKGMVQQDLQLYQTSFEAPLSEALWDLDQERIQTIIPGILKLPSIVGLEILDLNDTPIATGGVLPQSDLVQSKTSFLQIFPHKFSITYTKENENSKVGTGIFYSSNEIIFNKVSTGFLLIIINSIIKTIALWVIFLVIVKPMLVKPIVMLSQAASNLTLENVGQFKLKLGTKKRNELKMLEESFNEMASNLFLASSNLDKANKDIKHANYRLEMLLAGVKEMTLAGDKLTSMSNAASIILKTIPSLIPKTVKIIYQDYGPGGIDIYRSHLFQKANIEAGFATLNDAECDKTSKNEPEAFTIALKKGQTNSVQFENNLLHLPIWRDTELLALLDIETTENILLIDEERDFVNALMQSLIISVEEIGVRSGLEVMISRRTAELQRSKRAIEKKVEDIEKLAKYKSEFVANMSHEIRTPMNAIIGFSNRALKNNTIEHDQDYFRKINSSANSLMVIINDILDFSKLEFGKLRLDNIEFELSDIINNLTDIVSHDIYQKKLDLFVETTADVTNHLIGDSSRLQQVLINLVGNAIKFTDTGFILIKVTQKFSSENNIELCFSIEDTGSGIPKEKLGELFNAFTQVDSSITRRYGGTGLGLSISKQLITLMGGEIWVESELGKGACFSFTVQFLSSAEQTPLLEFNKAFKTNRVLIVSDNEMETQVWRKQLRSMGGNISVLTSFEEGLNESIDINNEYALILVAGENNYTNSTEVIIQSLANETINKIIVATPHFNYESIIQNYRALGVNHFLAKPVLPSSLAKILNSFDSPYQLTEIVAQDEPVPNDEWWLDGRFAQRRILLVEDSFFNQELVKAFLEDGEILVTVANNGQECLDKISQDSFDLVFMDIQMPIMDGLTATKRLREQSAYQSIPIIAMSAHVLPEDKQKSLDAGMNGHIDKPIDIIEMFNTIAYWFNQ